MKPRSDAVRLMLVYQAGIANLFRVASFNKGTYARDAVRVYQGDFRTAEAMARGAELAGAIVRVSACNQAGDIIDATWNTPLGEAPFSSEFRCAEAWIR